MKNTLKVIAIVLITLFIVNAHNHMRHEFNHARHEVRFDKSKTSYVEVGRLLKPYEVATLLINNKTKS